MQREILLARVCGYEVSVSTFDDAKIGVVLRDVAFEGEPIQGLGPAEARMLGAVLIQAAAEVVTIREAIERERSRLAGPAVR